MTEAGTREEKRKKIIAGFAAYNVPAAELDRFLGHSLAEITPDEIVELQGIWLAIKDGARWSEYCAPDEPEQKPSSVSADDLQHGKVTTEDRPTSTPEKPKAKRKASKRKPKATAKKAPTDGEKAQGAAAVRPGVGDPARSASDEGANPFASESEEEAEERRIAEEFEAAEHPESADKSGEEEAERYAGARQAIAMAPTAEAVDLIIDGIVANGDLSDEHIEKIGELAEEQKQDIAKGGDV